MNNNLSKKSKKQLHENGKTYEYYSISSLKDQGYDIKGLPYSIRVLLESVLRQYDGHAIKEEHIRNLANWTKNDYDGQEVPFKPARVILQDFTGVPAVVDLAALRDAMNKLGGDVNKINPEIPVDLVIDHSVQVDKFGTEEALDENMKIEFKRNSERYEFLRWAQEVFEDFNVVPPATGIIHQVNLEYLASVVAQTEADGVTTIFPDSLVGTDSHTTMINGLGVLGWGVGGIEAEAGMLGQPSYFTVPDVVGVRLTGQLKEGVTATDLALRLTQILREHGVVAKFVEYFGEGMGNLSLADRATIANMAPEYGATCGFFPADEKTLEYLKLTGRSDDHIKLVESYLRANDMFYTSEGETPAYTETIELDLGTVETSLAGPKRPQDRISLSDMKEAFEESITSPVGNSGHGLTDAEFDKQVEVRLSDGRTSTVGTGSVVIASITSCTNTSNPMVMIGAGILARNAVEKGLEVPAHVKTSLAPGSRVVTDYLEKAGLQKYLDKLGFNTVGYGCATCIGNSGPLVKEVEDAIVDNDLVVTSVLSANRNFEGRIHQNVKANYLASPTLVVAYALAGTVNINLQEDSLGKDKEGNDIYLKDIWPDAEELTKAIAENVKPESFEKEYSNVYKSNELWNSIEIDDSPLYDFDENSTYIQNPPFFDNLSKDPQAIESLDGLRVIGKLGDSVTTDHISPAGAIGKSTPAGKYLLDNGVPEEEFNTYGSRRGNHEVMMRGTFANIRIRNQMAPGTEGGLTTYLPTDEVMPIYDACMKYKEDGTGLVVLAGKDYGMGSSRDWAAKGTNLLGIKTVIAESYERIHRSNLVMMGVLPLQFLEGESAASLGLTGKETYSVEIDDNVKPRDVLKVTAKAKDGSTTEFSAIARFDSEVEMDYYRHGGILQMVLRDKLN